MKRFGALSCAKIGLVLYGLIGLVTGIFFFLIGIISAALGHPPDNWLFGIGGLIIWPIFYGLIGLIGGAIMAWLYNVVASWVGGIEMQFEEDTPPPDSYVQG